MSLPIDPIAGSQGARELGALERLEREYRERVPAYPGLDAPPAALAAHGAAHDAAVEVWLLGGGDPDALAAHQASRARTGEAPLDAEDAAAVALAIHRAHERSKKSDPPLLPLEAASSPTAPGDDAPATPEVLDRDGMTPEAALIVGGHAAGIVHAAQMLCAAIDDAAQVLTTDEQSGMDRIETTWPRQSGRPRGAGPNTPASAVRHLMHVIYATTTRVRGCGHDA